MVMRNVQTQPSMASFNLRPRCRAQVFPFSDTDSGSEMRPPMDLVKLA